MKHLRNILHRISGTIPLELRCLHDAVISIDPSARIEGGQVRLENGLCLRTQCIDASPFFDGNIKTSTITIALHEKAFPEGLIEHQHSCGTDREASMRLGFRTWVRLYLHTLIHSFQDDPQGCPFMRMTLPDAHLQGTGARQIVFGPTDHYGGISLAKEECHPFCPCCLFTNSMQAFRKPLDSTEFLTISLFASRYEKGRFSADCRINGENYTPALPHLIKYAQSWPGEGLEFRKQYIVIRNKP